MRLVLDTGALIALERGDRAMWRRFAGALHAREPPVTHGGVVGQAWRGSGPRQALLSRALAGIEVVALDEHLGRAAGALLALSGASDVIDAVLVLVTEDGDLVCTSDPGDLAPLAASAGRRVEILAV